MNKAQKRKLGYYSTPQFISSFLYQRLTKLNNQGSSLLDVGIGAEELTEYFIKNNIDCTGIDIFKHKENYKSKFIHQDFIDYYKENPTTNFDFIISNPPYNCHESEYISKNKNELKSIFGDIGTFNMYSIFLSAILDIAKEGAILGIITLDSFLSHKSYYKLREKILKYCIIHDVIPAPTDLFTSQGADVRTSILILEKTSRKELQGDINISERAINSNIFNEKLTNTSFKKIPISRLILNSKVDFSEFLIDIPESIIKLFSEKRIGDYFKCITGISTGNDKEFLSKSISNKHSIPFYKNPGNNKFFTQPNNFIIDDYLIKSKIIKNFIVRNKQFIGKSGITCSSMGVEFSACYLPKNSAFGVNPNIFCDNPDDIWWLISYLNSNLVKFILRSILIRGNMITSGYVSRLPLISFSNKEKHKLSDLSKRSYDKAKLGMCYLEDLEKINNIIFNAAKIPPNDQNHINIFCENIIKMS